MSTIDDVEATLKELKAVMKPGELMSIVMEAWTRAVNAHVKLLRERSAMITIEPFTPRDLGPKPWGDEILIAETHTYIGKLLRMNAGHRGGLQYHAHKDETFYLYSGTARVTSDDGRGYLTSSEMTPGMSFHIPPLAVHQVEAITDCVFFEVSTPVFDDRVNVGAAYGRADAGDAE